MAVCAEPKKKKLPKAIKAVLAVLCVIAVIVGAELISYGYRSDPEKVKEFETQNPYIAENGITQISAHRSGGGIMPEETMMAFKNCAENPDFSVDWFEFDLHITKDDVLVLLHDDTLDRTSDSETVFGEEDVGPEDKTYEELRTLNMGADFETEDGEKPYAALSGAQVPDDLKIVRVDDVLDYLESVGGGRYHYIIEIKNSDDLGKRALDVLYGILTEKGLLSRVIFGTFNEEVSIHADENYPDLNRSATIKEVLEFYSAAVTNDEDFEPAYTALQIPYSMPFRLIANLGTAQVVNYAHEHNLAVQYWTINDKEDYDYLCSIGTDCIMTDYPDVMSSGSEETPAEIE